MGGGGHSLNQSPIGGHVPLWAKNPLRSSDRTGRTLPADFFPESSLMVQACHKPASGSEKNIGWRSGSYLQNTNGKFLESQHGTSSIMGTSVVVTAGFFVGRFIRSCAVGFMPMIYRQVHSRGEGRAFKRSRKATVSRQ